MSQLTLTDELEPGRNADELRDAQAAAAAADAGMAQAFAADRVQVWKASAAAWLDGLEPGVTFTADDLVAAIGLADHGDRRNNVIGAWLAAQSRRGTVQWTGRFRKSERIIGHGNLQRVWRVAAVSRDSVTV